MFQLFSNKGRFRIACLLARSEFCVNEITEVVSKGKTSNISQQLKILTLSGVIERRREDQRILYCLKAGDLSKRRIEMKRLLILGAGTAGTMMANHLRKKVNLEEWRITVVDQYPQHYYQPGFLFMPFGLYSEKDVVKPKRKFIPRRSGLR